MKHFCVGLALLPLLSIAASATVNVSTPKAGSTVTSPVQYTATATTSTCSKGVASMGIYVNNKKIYVVSGAKLNTSISLSAGSQHTVVEEWDKCGGATTATINLTVAASASTSVSMSANPTSISEGGSSTLTVTAKNASQVNVTGSDGSSYQLSSSGGSQSVSPSSTTTYTAVATGTKGSASATSTVTVESATNLQSVKHVIFELQENHSFDSYFGMLNPYRSANGWNVGDDGVTYNVDGIDDKLKSISNVDDEGKSYSLFKLKSTCLDDMSSAWLSSYGDVNRFNFLTSRSILMDGFVHTSEGYAKSCASSGTCSGNFTDLSGERSMGYFDEEYLNYYYYMASQFAVSDRWFSPMSSKSVDNRIATYTGGTTQGLVEDPGSANDHLPQPSIATIFQELDNAKVSWKVYYTVTQGFCLSDDECGTSGNDRYPATYLNYLSYFNRYVHSKTTPCASPMQPSSVVGDSTNSFCIDPTHIAPISQYYTDLSNNALPSFAFIEAGYGRNDEHPGSGQSVLNGQYEVANIVNALMSSTSWSDSVFFFSYDEGGGPYDHVPPVPGHSNDKTSSSMASIPDISSIAVNPDSYFPCVPAGSAPTTHCDLKSSDPGAHSGDAAKVKGFAAQLGFRVPNMIISPFTRRHYVSHTPMDHTAVIKFVENRFIGPSTHLTARDAAQPNLLEFFDFTNVPWATPPAPPVPVTASSLGFNPCTPASM